MSRCRTCSKEIFWIKIRDRNIPVEELLNLLPDSAGSHAGIDVIGRTIKGHIVGDAHENGYVMVYKIHRCGGQP